MIRKKDINMILFEVQVGLLEVDFEEVLVVDLDE
jgi:hypothetical protein